MTFHTAISPDLIGFATSFLFVFAIVFALLAYSKIIKSRSAAGVLAAAIALSSSLFPPFQAFLQVIIPIATALLIILFFFVFINKLLGGGRRRKDVVPAAVGLAVMLLVLAAIWPQVASFFGFTGLTPTTVITAIGIVAILVIIVLAYKAGMGGGAPPPRPPAE